MAVLVDEICRDAEAVLRSAAMLSRGRSVAWIKLDPMGVVMREDGGRAQAVHGGRYENSGPWLHLFPPHPGRQRNAMLLAYGRSVSRVRATYGEAKRGTPSAPKERTPPSNGGAFN